MKPTRQTDTAGEIARQKHEISALAQKGKFTKAKELCLALCKKTPDDPEAWFLMGAINGQLSDFPEAEICCRNAIPLAPQHPMLHFNLAIALLNQGNAQEAIESLERAIKLQPDFANAHLELGNARTLNKEPLLAVNSYQKAIELEPGSHLAVFNLGNAYRDLGLQEEAIEQYKQATLLEPAFTEAYCEIATILITQFRFVQAISLLESAIKCIPESPKIFLMIAIAHEKQGDSAIALQYFRKVLELEEDNIDAQVGIAGILGMQGDYTTAGKSLEKILALHPENPTAVITYAHFAHRLGTIDKAIRMVKDTLENSNNSERVKSELYFSLAQLYERNDQTDIAFDNYVTGNRLRGAEFNYKSYRDMFNAIMDAYSEKAFKQLPRSTNSSRTPVFIVGMPRSGTSLAEQIIASHPDVFGAGELCYINSMVDQLPQTLDAPSPYPLCLDKLTTPVANQLANEYLEKINDRSGGTRYVIDKMPLNFMHIGFIELLFPKARIIHCARDPVDTCLSCFFKCFSGEHSYAYSLTDLGNYHRLYQQLMSHWKQVSGLPIHTLVYEDMVTNQEYETRRLIEFCGLEWNDACLDFHKTERTVATASFDQVRQPIYSHAVGRWRLYEKRLEPLLSALQMDS